MIKTHHNWYSLHQKFRKGKENFDNISNLVQELIPLKEIKTVIKKGKRMNINITFSVCAISSSISNVQLGSLHQINYVPHNLKDKDGTENY